MRNIIIKLINGEEIVNTPGVGGNFDDPVHIARFLHTEGSYAVYTKHKDCAGVRTIHNREFVRADYEEKTPIVTVVGGGHKYVKLQQVIELMKHAEKMWSLPYYEFDELSKTKTKIDNSIAFLKRNAKTKEEL